MPGRQRLPAGHAPTVLAFELAVPDGAVLGRFSRLFGPGGPADLGGKDGTWYRLLA
jgi:hypothetical protein